MFLILLWLPTCFNHIH